MGTGWPVTICIDMSNVTSTRQARILEILARDGFADVRNLKRLLSCSEATVRRDLVRLQRAGYLRRTHGGAISNNVRELPFRAKLGTMAEAKQRIAQAAAGSVGKRQAIGFTGGTTMQQVARKLASRTDLTVITNALTVAMELAASDTRVIVTGGELRRQTCELVGPLAEPVAAQINLDLMFVGVDGLSLDGGLTTHNPMEASINRMLIDCSRQVTVVTDHTKLGRDAFAQIAPFGVISTLITDVDAPEEQTTDFEEAGVRVIKV
jgi:DeoR family transcriptional regulator, aga operon transcriptional repressor